MIDLDIRHDSHAAALDEIVRELLEQTDCQRPPVDAVRMARKMGMEVRLDRTLVSRGRLVRLRPQPAIFLRPEPRPERQQWTVAHEIAEQSMDQIAAALAIDARELGTELRERLANGFAPRLLVPTDWFAFDCRLQGFDLFALKRIYATASHETLALRFLDLDPPTIVTIFDNGALTRRLGNGGVPPPVTAAELEMRRLVEESGQPQRWVDQRMTLQGWPIHEPGWKRQIIRCVLDWDPA